MSRFTLPITLMQVSDREWSLQTSDLAWEIGHVGSGTLVQIPRGFTTDLASVPRILWPIVPPFGRHTNAAVLHDFLYRAKDRSWSRRWADRQFLEAMQALKVPAIRARVMWIAVRLFGWRAWRRVAASR